MFIVSCLVRYDVSLNSPCTIHQFQKRTSQFSSSNCLIVLSHHAITYYANEFSSHVYFAREATWSVSFFSRGSARSRSWKLFRLKYMNFSTLFQASPKNQFSAVLSRALLLKSSRDHVLCKWVQRSCVQRTWGNLTCLPNSRGSARSISWKLSEFKTISGWNMWFSVPYFRPYPKTNF